MKNNIEEKNIPKGWQQEKIKNLGRFTKGAGISKSELVARENNAVRYGELYTKFNFKIDCIYSFIPHEAIASTKEIKYGDIVFAGSGETIDEIGKSAAYLKKEKCYASGDTIIFSPKNDNSLFLAYLLNIDGARKELRRLGQGQSVVHIYKSDIENVIVSLPPLPEQKRIVKVLETWDKAIEKLTKKIEIKKNIKKGLMQRLLTGKVRLPKFNGKWKYFKIKDQAVFVKGIRTNGGEKYYLEIGDVDINSKTYNIEGKQKLSVNGAVKVPKGTVLVSTVRPTRGAMTILLDNMYVSGAFCRLKIKNKFVYYIMQQNNFLKFLGDNSKGGTYPTCNYDDILNFEFPAPTLAEEQKEIANILTITDQLIVSLTKRKKLLIEQKKYLLNNLVTGKIRVLRKIASQ